MVCRRILVVDDDVASREMLATFLTLHGYLVCTARDGLEALEASARFHPDLVCTDVCMPRMDGIKLSELLRADPLTHKAVLFAVTALREDQEPALMRTHFDAHFSKPVDLEALEGSIRTLGH
jgi:CheY-like chemotaxis protein